MSTQRDELDQDALDKLERRYDSALNLRPIGLWVSRAFYLVAMEIGTDKATLIWYHALQKLWTTAKFNDAVDVIVDSARILTRQKQVPVGSTQQVRAAFREVGLPHLT